MLLRPSRPFRPALGWMLAIAGVCVLVPLRLTAVERSAKSAARPVEARAAEEAGETGTLASPVAVAQLASLDHGSTIQVDEGDDGEAYAYFRDEDSATMSGSTHDFDRARNYAKSGSPLLWARHDGREWIIRDAQVLDRVEEIFAPVRELGRKQGELGAQQGALGAQQGQLGAQQGALGAQQGQLGAQQATIAGQMAQLNAQRLALAAQGLASDADHAALEAKASELERAMDELESRISELGGGQGDLGEQQRQLGEKQRALGDQQRELGEKQRELGEQQREASDRAKKQLGELLDEAIRGGKATEVH